MYHLTPHGRDDPSSLLCVVELASDAVLEADLIKQTIPCTLIRSGSTYASCKLTLVHVWSVLQVELRILLRRAVVDSSNTELPVYSCFNSQLIFGMASGLLQISSVWGKHTSNTVWKAWQIHLNISTKAFGKWKCTVRLPARSFIWRRHNILFCWLCFMISWSFWQLFAISSWPTRYSMFYSIISFPI